MHDGTRNLAGKACFIGAVLLAIGSTAGVAAGTKRTLPYFASIGAGRARMRTGPARTYPASWLYQRADLPVRVIATYKEWRKIEDPDGHAGVDGRSAAARRAHGDRPRAQAVEMHEQPSTASRLVWRAAPGVVGRIGQCGSGWCRMDVKGQVGFVEIGNLWGVGPTESLP